MNSLFHNLSQPLMRTRRFWDYVTGQLLHR